ncbi:ADP-ribose pyrophosphatase, mitochondrial [Bacillus rossius redtenbacheri]|uniref:ADP-ribose pyrophosphatase, mitochondrial n=1 Tax=Bacillus rossius redtenbacheri TaxID=93214 RepID=UPI002FDEE490
MVLSLKCFKDAGHYSSLYYLIRMIHFKSRTKFYPRTNEEIVRLHVPDDKVKWDVTWTEYAPPSYTSDNIRNQTWADPPIGAEGFNPKWNEIDGNVNRESHQGMYKILNGVPLNIVGRTGLCGRGLLGRWGPNHAADPIVTRWKRNTSNNRELHSVSQKHVLQFVGIQRRDTREWALPGGMVDPGEQVTTTLKREFMEEALNSLGSRSAIQSEKMIDEFFAGGKVIFKGYVDDHRNTDNAWIETVASNFHDEQGTCVGVLPFCAGDDAVNVRWMDVDRNLSLYASHIDLIHRVAELHNCHW